MKIRFRRISLRRIRRSNAERACRHDLAATQRQPRKHAKCTPIARASDAESAFLAVIPVLKHASAQGASAWPVKMCKPSLSIEFAQVPGSWIAAVDLLKRPAPFENFRLARAQPNIFRSPEDRGQ